MVVASRRIRLLLLALPLSGCGTNMDSLQDGTKQVTQGVTDNYQYVKKDVTDMFTYKPNKPQPHPVPPSYCYRVMQDIVCYSTAESGAADRLVAYQGSVLVEPKPVQQASVAPVTAQPQAAAESTPGPAPKPAIAPLVSMAIPQTQEQKSRTEESMAHFAVQSPVTVDAPPAVKADSPAQ